MACPSSCCPKPSMKSQLEEELDLGRRLGLPQLPGSQKCGRACKEGAVCRRAGVLPIRGPFPCELVGDARREGHRTQPIVHLNNFQHDLLCLGTRNVSHPSFTFHRCAYCAPPAAQEGGGDFEIVQSFLLGGGTDYHYQNAIPLSNTIGSMIIS